MASLAQAFPKPWLEDSLAVHGYMGGNSPFPGIIWGRTGELCANLPDSPGAGLLGRDKELRFLRSFLREAAALGGALLGFREMPGSARPHCLAWLPRRQRALALGLSGRSVPSLRAYLSFAGLSQVLLPLLGEAESLSAAHRDALLGVLGLGGSGAAVDRLVLFSATFGTKKPSGCPPPVADRGRRRPVAGPGKRAGAWVCRAAPLPGPGSGCWPGTGWMPRDSLNAGGLTELVVRPLDEASPAALVQACFPVLAVRVRQRVLAEAEGYPLALIELPTELAPRNVRRGKLPPTFRLAEPAPARGLRPPRVQAASGDPPVAAARGD